MAHRQIIIAAHLRPCARMPRFDNKKFPDRKPRGLLLTSFSKPDIISASSKVHRFNHRSLGLRLTRHRFHFMENMLLRRIRLGYQRSLFADRRTTWHHTIPVPCDSEKSLSPSLLLAIHVAHHVPLIYPYLSHMKCCISLMQHANNQTIEVKMWHAKSYLAFSAKFCTLGRRP